MKKMFFVIVMLIGMAMSANAQDIISKGCNQIVLRGGIILDASRISNANMLRVGEDINTGIARVNMIVDQQRRIDAMNAAYTDMYATMANAAAYGSACYGGVVAPVPVVAPVAVGGYENSGFSIGNEHWGFSTNSSKCGAYESGSTNVRIGGFHIGTYKSGMSKAAEQATANYSNMKNNVASSTRSTSNIKVVNIKAFLKK